MSLFSLSKLNFYPLSFCESSSLVDLSAAADLRVDSKIKPSKSKTSSNKLLHSNEGKKWSAHAASCRFLSPAKLHFPSFSWWSSRIRRVEEPISESSDPWIYGEDHLFKEHKHPAGAWTSRLDRQIWRPPVAELRSASDSWEVSPPLFCQEMQTSEKKLPPLCSVFPASLLLHLPQY